MDALILAAGRGSRLRAVEPCKPLTLLHGVSLLEIGVRQLANAGADRIVVATGYRAEAIEAALPDISARVGVPVAARRIGDYRQPNGHSVVEGAADFDGDFLLVMADHVLSRAVLRKLASAQIGNNSALLAVDRRLSSPLIDPDDATWVATDANGKILRIGKAIANYDAVDCGAFRVTRALCEAIEGAIRDGLPGSLSDGMQRLADAGRAATVDIGDTWWIDVDDARALDLARAQIRGELPELFAVDGDARVSAAPVEAAV